MKKMQRLLFWVLAALILSSCGTSYQENRQRRAAEKAAERAAIIQAIEDCNFILEVTQIIPQRFPSRHSQGEYQLRLEGDVVTTRLPFIGVSYEPTYGGTDEISIVFEKEKVQLIKNFSNVPTKGEYIFQFAGGKGKTPWMVTLSVFESGSASIYCAASGGRNMSYFANLVIPKKDENP